MWLFKKQSPKKIGFELAARFNYELDVNEELRRRMTELALRSRELGRAWYCEKLLGLFNDSGFDLSMEELDKLLLLRRKTDQLLREQQQDGGKPSADGAWHSAENL